MHPDRRFARILVSVLSTQEAAATTRRQAMTAARNQELARLLKQVTNGDAAAFQRLYDATAARMYGLAIRMLGSGAVADDVVQDAYVQVWHRAGDYQSDRGSVVVWLSAIVRYRAIDALRARRHEVVFDESTGAGNSEADVIAVDDAGAGTAPLGSAIAADDSEFLKRCLARLSGAQRDTRGTRGTNGGAARHDQEPAASQPAETPRMPCGTRIFE